MAQPVKPTRLEIEPNVPKIYCDGCITLFPAVKGVFEGHLCPRKLTSNFQRENLSSN